VLDQDRAGRLVHHSIGRTTSEAVPRFVVSAVADNDQIESPGLSKLDDSPRCMPSDYPGVQLDALLLSQLKRLALDSRKVAVLELLLVLDFVDGGREAGEVLLDRQSPELGAVLAAQRKAPSEGAPGGFRPFESNQDFLEHASTLGCSASYAHEQYRAPVEVPYIVVAAPRRCESAAASSMRQRRQLTWTIGAA
jgi:hypothetical protein